MEESLNPILGFTEPDPVGVALGTGMQRFSSPFGIHGLCEESPDWQEINLLAVIAARPGTGQFREFVRSCKQNYHLIRVIEVGNPELSKALFRYGFVEQKWTDRFGEKLDVMVWRQP